MYVTIEIIWGMIIVNGISCIVLTPMYSQSTLFDTIQEVAKQSSSPPPDRERPRRKRGSCKVCIEECGRLDKVARKARQISVYRL